MLPYERSRCMFGKNRDGITYYSFRPQANDRGRTDAYAGHPQIVYLGEDAILEVISAFLSDRLFGPHRRDLLAAVIASVDDWETRQREAQRDQFQGSLDLPSRRRENIPCQGETGDPDDPFTKGLRTKGNELDSERQTHLAALAELDAVDAAVPSSPTLEDAHLLDGLPCLVLNPRPRSRTVAQTALRGHPADRPSAL